MPFSIHLLATREAMFLGCLISVCLEDVEEEEEVGREAEEWDVKSSCLCGRGEPNSTPTISPRPRMSRIWGAMAGSYLSALSEEKRSVDLGKSVSPLLKTWIERIDIP